ncbi:Probable carboxylesterase 2 [Striga hermonthica]|uniref:Probable carboxylesterase 2 n=1 Tax=Striga hermonthica TaxID=68872 RepID=A0A9N7R2R0_STRHE|nr:Probable carboxylesterase 2 [Striga hermonthica]
MPLTKPLLLICSFLIFHLLSTPTTSTNTSSIAYQVLPFIRVFENGTVERLTGTETVPASYDSTSRVLSKDISIPISRALNITARLYRPANATADSRKLPLLVYFHGGAFFVESAFSPTYHNHLNSVVSKAHVVGVSVNYRLAPEHPLPTAYRDSWHALKWAFSRGREPWLERYVDFKRVYVAGDSAGGNIAHNVGIRAGLDERARIDLKGMFLNCPRFWGEELIGNERRNPRRVAFVESVWVHAYPKSTGFDDPLLNPLKDPNLSMLGPKEVLVYVGEKDIYRDRGFAYGKALKKSKWGGVVQVIEVKGEDHVFNLNFPNSTKAKVMLGQLALFLDQGRT